MAKYNKIFVKHLDQELDNRLYFYLVQSGLVTLQAFKIIGLM